jgi:hypothetical protein
MSKWPMRGHFRYLRFKTFPMTPRTPQCEVFWALLSGSEHSGSRRTPTLHFFQVLGFTPTLGQSRVATVVEQKAIWMRAWWVNVKNTIWGMVVASPESGPWWVMWIQGRPWLVPTPNTCRMDSNRLRVGFGCIFNNQVAWSLLSLIPKLSTRPSTPLSVGSWERHQVSNHFRKSNYLDLFWVKQGT